MQGQECEKHETVPRSAGFVCIPGPKDVVWFSHGTKDAHMRQCRLYLLPVSHSGSASQAKQWTGYGPLAWTIHRSNHRCFTHPGSEDDRYASGRNERRLRNRCRHHCRNSTRRHTRFGRSEQDRSQIPLPSLLSARKARRTSVKASGCSSTSQ